ncbi:HdeD family acid-resistance protein [Colwellia sp. TT2012]|uniref:HdeD family acid-resistance protein n=1 Tax=Colwellia sp. TT2012 TaxID=1720342 RepID=UPI0009EA48F7|nr:DUF308 domain-containing protein [Colwellia sp. TT2012]
MSDIMDNSVQPDQSVNLTHLNQVIAKNAKTTGIVMIIIGVLAMLAPNVIGMTFNSFVGGIFLLASLVLAHNAWQSRTQQKNQVLTLWLQPFVLAMLGFIILLNPAIVLSMLGLLIAIYFIFSGFSAIAWSFELKSSAKWFSLFNGILSFVLGVLVFDSWPFGSAWIIGLLIGISFLFDGFALLSIARQLENNQE